MISLFDTENPQLLTLVIPAATLLLTGTIDAVAVMSRDVMMLQQNSYRNDRYGRWFNQSGESTRLGRIFCCIGLMLMLVQRLPFMAGAAAAAIITLWQAIYLFTRKYKKPLVWTPRARRIFGTMMALAAIIVSLITVFVNFKYGCIALMVILIASPLLLIAANDLLRPVEKHINRKYYDDAARILASMPDLKIIGITGSYGKTSTKHYLKRILEEHFATAMTPGSFNTTMGVIRTIREHLKPYDEVFIVEMGAKQPGDIKEICDLVHPQIGIITAVGCQHLESFKTIENVQRTKFELADAIGPDGLVVVNNDFPFVANRKVANTQCLRYAVAHPDQAHYIATDIAYTPQGATFTITGKNLDNPLTLTTRLTGECNISNLMGAVIVALHLGVPTEKIRYAVSQIEPVEHRLSIKRTPAGITILDDAFNSNPEGSRMALDVLSRMTTGQRIIITPGMIELGERQFQANEQFGQNIARCADVAIVVGVYNREAIIAGINAAQMPADKVHTVDTFADAQRLLATIVKPGDTVLYENDLPDLFK